MAESTCRCVTTSVVIEEKRKSLTEDRIRPIMPHMSLLGARRRFLAAVLLAACLALVLPGTSEAHAILLRSDPAKDAVLHVAPDRVHLWFSETLNPAFSTAVVESGANQRVDHRDAQIAPGDASEMDVTLQPNLPPAVYVVVWRTDSNDDGHVMPGSFLFTVARPDGSIPTLSGGTIPGRNALGGSNLTGLYSGQLDGPALFNLIMITLVELGAVFWVGAQFWQLFVLLPATEDHAELGTTNKQVQQRFERRFALPTLLVLLVANLGVLIGQAINVTGGNFGSALAPGLLASLVTSGRFGTFWLMRVIVIFLALRLALYQIQFKQRPPHIDHLLRWANLVLGLALFIAITMSSHAAAVSPTSLTLALVVDWLHLVAAALWVGGMLYIAAIYLPALRRTPISERTHALITVLPYYSPWAITGILLMALTGPLSATVHLSSWEQLLSTAYGRALVVKVLLVGGLLLTSAYHVLLLRPRLSKEYQKYAYVARRLAALQATPAVVQVSSDREEAEPRPTPKLISQQVRLREGRVAKRTGLLTRILGYEPVLGVAVLVCVGLMNVFAGTLSPTATAQPQPTGTARAFHTTVKTADGKFTIALTVNPNTAGPNLFTVSVIENSTGKPTTNAGVSLYTTHLDMDMGTDTVNLQPDGKGHFSATGDLVMGGHWQIRIQIRTPDNTLHEATVKEPMPF